MQFQEGFKKLLPSNDMVAEFKQTALKCQGAILSWAVKCGHNAVSVSRQIPVTSERPFDYRDVSFLLCEYAGGGLVVVKKRLQNSGKLVIFFYAYIQI